MKSTFFQDCNSLQEVKKRFKELAFKHHPDCGGDTATMQQINSEYEAILKNPFFTNSESGTTEQDKEEFLIYKDIINAIIALSGITIELIGNWVWVSGNTYPHRLKLKESGFFFAPKKTMWYYRPAEYKSSNSKPKSIDDIRLKYGSDLIKQSQSFNALAG